MNATHNEPLQHTLFSPEEYTLVSPAVQQRESLRLAKVIEFPRFDTGDEHFGVCPKCFRTEGHLNIGPDHWYHCRKHKLKWNVGSNLFSAWRHESESQWAANAQLLAGYEEVEAYHPVSLHAVIPPS